MSAVSSPEIGPAAGKLWRIRWVCVFCNATGSTNRFTLNVDRVAGVTPAFGGSGITQFQVVQGLTEIVLEAGEKIFLNSGSAAAQFIATLFGSERTL